MDWEGPEALIEIGADDPSIKKVKMEPSKKVEIEVRDKVDEESAEESGDDGSEDDYIAEPSKKRRKLGKVCHAIF